MDGVLLNTMIAYGAMITINVLDDQYDLRVEGQGQIYLKSILWL